MSRESEPPPRYLVLLTCVRTLGIDREHRNEHADPEPVLEAFGIVDMKAAQRIFAALCALSMVKAGRQRAKVIEVVGRDTSGVTRRDAPLATSATRALVSVGAPGGGELLSSEALSVIAVHTDSGGLCRGCMDFAARLSWWPCLQVEWARAAVAAVEAESAPDDAFHPQAGAVSGVYGRQELPEEPGSSPEDYLRLLYRRQPDRRPPEEEPMRNSDLRWRLFSVMVGDPDAEWTATALAAALTSDPQEDPGVVDARTQAVRDTVTVLMADRWVEPVPFQRLLTVRLTATGRTQLRQLLLAWSADVRAGEISG